MNTTEDPLAPARGIMIGLAICIPFWVAVVMIIKKVRQNNIAP